MKKPKLVRLIVDGRDSRFDRAINAEMAREWFEKGVIAMCSAYVNGWEYCTMGDDVPYAVLKHPDTLHYGTAFAFRRV